MKIVILDQANKPESATDATDATHYRNGGVQNGLVNDGNKSSDSGQSSINSETEPVTARIDPIAEHTNHENEVYNNNSINRIDKLNNENSEKEACLSSKCVASVASVANIYDKNEKDVPESSKSVASVADNGVTTVGLPEIPCAWCDYKNAIEFDLGNHLFAIHRDELLKLPIGKGSMEIRIDYAIQRIKRIMVAQYNEEDEDEDIVEDDA